MNRIASQKLPMPSISQIKLKSDRMIKQFSNYNNLTQVGREHRSLNAFIHVYKEKLQIKDPGDNESNFTFKEKTLIHVF